MSSFSYGLLIFLSVIVISFQSNFEGHIVGGNYANIRHVPHSVYLVMKSGEEWVCGASVLNQNIVLTAGHCLYDCTKSSQGCNIVAYAGSANIERVRALRHVDRYIIHRNYNDGTLVNDVALARLTSPLKLGPHIKRIILLRRWPLQGSTVSVAGWGVTDEKVRTQTLRLKVARVTVRPRGECQRVGQLTSGMLCAGSTYGNADRPAEGDSGSALITDSFQQIGLVSFKVEKYPALVIYTNVSHYYRWISREAAMLHCQPRG